MTVTVCLPAEMSLEMIPHIEGAEAVTIAGAGHLSNLEAPDAFDDALSGHLERFRLV